MTQSLLPRFIRILRRFEQPRITDVGAETRAQLEASGVSFSPGATVAIAVGSRGIANLQVIVQQIVAWLRDQGAKPFVVPAMGSHGGATAEGQAAVLEGYGITEEATGAPVVASMEVVELPSEGLDAPVFFDRIAYGADATVIVNRVKPHTSFHGPHESGLLKMTAIGLGKNRQAAALHRLGVAGLRDVMPKVAEQSLRHNNVRLAVAVVENAREETMIVRAVPTAQIAAVDRELLALAREAAPALPCRELDLLIVDEMGKDISGLGMDTGVIGRLRIPGQPEPETPRIRVIMARDLTPATRGNACGVGLADIVTRTLFDKIDFPATYQNVLTTGFLERGKIPLIAGSDREALDFAARALGTSALDCARVIRIRNTLCLDRLWVSAQLLKEVASLPDVETLGAVETPLTSEGRLTDL
jgi:hypothetical protein